MARENVPSSTTTLNTFTFIQCNSCIITVKTTRHATRINAVLALIHALSSGVITVRSFIPFMSMK